MEYRTPFRLLFCLYSFRSFLYGCKELVLGLPWFFYSCLMRIQLWLQQYD